MTDVGVINLTIWDNPVSPPRRIVGHLENLYLGAAEGCGGSLQDSWLQGFDTLGLHQICPFRIMVLHLFCNQDTAVRFCHGAPSFVSVSKWKHVQSILRRYLDAKGKWVRVPAAGNCGSPFGDHAGGNPSDIHRARGQARRPVGPE